MPGKRLLASSLCVLYRTPLATCCEELIVKMRCMATIIALAVNRYPPLPVPLLRSERRRGCSNGRDRRHNGSWSQPAFPRMLNLSMKTLCFFFVLSAVPPLINLSFARADSSAQHSNGLEGWAPL